MLLQGFLDPLHRTPLGKAEMEQDEKFWEKMGREDAESE
jgi:hypothetical protein